MTPRQKATRIAEASKLGSVEAFALACIMPEPRALVTCSDVFAAYRNWCVAQGLAPLRESLFIEAFDELAREVGIPVRQRGSNLSYADVKLGA